MEILGSKSYNPQQIRPAQLSDALVDVELLEIILSSELCVFILDEQLSHADVLLAMAHAHSVPTIRLQYDSTAAKVDTEVESARIRWSNEEALFTTFREQVDSYRMGFVDAVSTDDIRKIGITKRDPRPEQLWNPADGGALINHIDIANPHVRETVSAARKLMGGTFVGGDLLEICTLIYRIIRTQHFAYEHEPASTTPGRQAIRTADDIWNDNASTCLDLACLFASLLKAAGLNPLILILVRPNFAHALVGYKQPSAPRWQDRPDMGDIRGSVALGDVVLFEPTGVAEHETRVAGELDQERREGNRTLDFAVAQTAAERLITSQIDLKYVFEVA